MGRIIYSDGRTALTTTAFRYKLTDSAGTLVKDWTTGATWTEEPAGTYYLDDEDAVPGTYYAVEPATGQVGGAGMVDWGEPAQAGDAMTLTTAYDHAKDDVLTPLAVVDGVLDDLAAVAYSSGVEVSELSLINIYYQVVSAIESYDPPKKSELDAAVAPLSTAANLAALDAKVVAVDAKVDTVDGILDTTLPLIQRVYRYFFNKRTHTNSAVTVYADDGVSVDASMTVTGDATTVTKDAPA